VSSQPERRPPLRFGIGYDSHRLVAGSGMRLGGVWIEGAFALAGHSDADVLTHAIIDALLGAAAMGDIGDRFPDDEERYRGADSMALLKDVLGALAARALAPWNVDATVIIERPRLGGAKAAIAQRLAQALALPIERVNVKATSGEGIGFIGRQEGAAALAVASLHELSQSPPRVHSAGADPPARPS
jgi:2-C-methyl-D-erythritol 2,4-cyclodiphosphate synthase